MALDKFRAAPLPNPPAQYDPQYVRQLIRVLENYFSQLDSRTPNNAEQYTADRFIGGSFSGTSVNSTSISTVTLDAQQAVVDQQRSGSIWTDGLTSSNHLNGNQVSGTIMANRFYGGQFYGDGRWLGTPYNQFQSDQDQTAVNVATANALTLNTDVFPNGITITSNSRITFADPGVYLLSYSIQCKNTDNSAHDIDIWLRYNGTDIANSNSRFSLPARKSSGDPSHLIAVTPLMVDVTAATHYVEIMWRVSNVAVSIEHFPAVAASPGVTPAIPATPSAIVTVTFISAQHPPVTRVAPLSVFGSGQVGAISVVTR